jgi:hypothetical protein
MLTKTKIALVAALVAGSATVASAQGFDPNPANRYPSYAAPGGQAKPYLGYAAAPQATAPRQAAASQGIVSRNVSAQRTLRSAPVALRSAPVALRSAPVAARTVDQSPVYYGSDGFQVDQSDRASSPYAGGVN